MRNGWFATILGIPALFLFGSAARAQGGDVYWRIDPGVKTCSMIIDPSLTQSQWSRFTRQAGAIVSFKSLAPAQPLGKRHFTLGIDNSRTPVDQHDLAWINTFAHPNEDCPLGDAIRIPTLRVAMGVSDRVDVGGFWTTAPGANYGVVGGELKYAFGLDSGRRPAAAARASVSVLTGVADFNMAVYSLDLMTSKRIARFSPYAGVKQSMSVGSETTFKVDLHRESVAITQGYAGVACSIWKLNLAAEYDASFVNTLALTAGVGF